MRWSSARSASSSPSCSYWAWHSVVPFAVWLNEQSINQFRKLSNPNQAKQGLASEMSTLRWSTVCLGFAAKKLPSNTATQPPKEQRTRRLSILAWLKTDSRVCVTARRKKIPLYFFEMSSKRIGKESSSVFGSVMTITCLSVSACKYVQACGSWGRLFFVHFCPNILSRTSFVKVLSHKESFFVNTKSQHVTECRLFFLNLTSFACKTFCIIFKLDQIGLHDCMIWLIENWRRKQFHSLKA